LKTLGFSPHFFQKNAPLGVQAHRSSVNHCFPSKNLRTDSKPANSASELISGIENFQEVSTCRASKASSCSRSPSERRWTLVVASADEDLVYTWAHNPDLMFDAGQIVGLTDDELLEPACARSLRNLKTKVLREGEGVREILQIARNGRPKFFDVTIEPLWGENRELIGVTMAALDITAIKETEEAALAASSAKTQFIAHVSHERDGVPVYRIEVHDSGIGLHPDQIARLFQPFSQADQSFARRFGGTGLGLLLSKGLARRLGEDLWLHSTEHGKGSVFVTEIPSRSKCENAVIANADVTALTASPSPRHRLLLVEDSKDNQIIVQMYLKGLHASIDVADKGQEGLQMALANSYDLILLDIQMPVLDGYQTLHELRVRGLQVPVLALTAHAINTEREKALKAGFQDFITKPINRGLLIEKIQSYLGGAEAAAPGLLPVAASAAPSGVVPSSLN
jgi:CheY-like chemotaxis protein